jgi:hypothetical protein
MNILSIKSLCKGVNCSKNGIVNYLKRNTYFIRNPGSYFFSYNTYEKERDELIASLTYNKSKADNDRQEILDAMKEEAQKEWKFNTVSRS